MIETKNSTYKGNPIIELHKDGSKVIGFGKRKAQAIVEAMQQENTRAALLLFADLAEKPAEGHADDHDLRVADDMGRAAGVV
tara:strand:- start:1331 stop:1576 length:246 start_codon:yes stop_codon:yes gene_type:complete